MSRIADFLDRLMRRKIPASVFVTMNPQMQAVRIAVRENGRQSFEDYVRFVAGNQTQVSSGNHDLATLLYIKEILLLFNLLLLLPATLESEPRIIQNPVKERAPFCKIDFDTPEGEAAFSEAVDALVEMLFDRIEAHNEKRECYERMLKN